MERLLLISIQIRGGWDLHRTGRTIPLHSIRHKEQAQQALEELLCQVYQDCQQNYKPASQPWLKDVAPMRRSRCQILLVQKHPTRTASSKGNSNVRTYRKVRLLPKPHSLLQQSVTLRKLPLLDSTSEIRTELDALIRLLPHRLRKQREALRLHQRHRSNHPRPSTDP